MLFFLQYKQFTPLKAWLTKEYVNHSYHRLICVQILKVHDFRELLSYIAIFCVAAALGFFLLVHSKRLFLFVKNELLRRNIVTFLIGICFFFAIGHIVPDFRNIMHDFGAGHGTLLCM